MRADPPPLHRSALALAMLMLVIVFLAVGAAACASAPGEPPACRPPWDAAEGDEICPYGRP